MIPVLFSLRGCALSCAEAILLFSGVPLLKSLLLLAVPGAFSLALLFIVGERCFEASRELLAACRGDGEIVPRNVSSRAVFTCIFLAAAAAFARLLVV